MDENNRSTRRTRTRPPYDLRRKVLLKNFLREQMTSIPVQSASEAAMDSENLDPVVIQSSSETMDVDVENDVSINEENIVEPASTPEEKDSETEDEEKNRGIQHHPSSPWRSTLVFDFSKITELKLSRLNPIKRKSTPLTAEDIKLIANKSGTKPKIEEECKREIIKSSTPIKKKVDLSQLPPTHKSKLLTQLKSKTSVKNKKKNGVVKAKHALLKSNKVPSKPVVIDAASKKVREHTLEGLKNRIKKVITMVQDLMKKNSEEMVLIKEEDLKLSVKSDSKDPSSTPDAKVNLTQIETDFVGKISKSGTLTEKNDIKNEERTLVNLEKSLWNGFGKHFPILYADKETAKKQKISSSKTLAKQTNDSDIIDDCYKESTSCTVSTQCIPDDMNWSLHEIRKLERANKRLREENKLLSESLSSIMADVDVAFNPYQKSTRTSPHNTAACTSQNIPTRSFERRFSIDSDGYNFPQSPTNSLKNISTRKFEERYPSNTDPSRVTILRSRSVLERAERRREVRLRLSSRSMCYRPYARISPRTLYKAKPCIITPCSSPEDFPLPNLDLPPTLPTHLDQSYCKTSLSRRSSMPEKNHRRFLPIRRSSCVHESKSSYNRQSLLSLPTEAFY